MAEKIQQQILERTTGLVNRFAYGIIIFYVIMAALAAYYTINHIGVNSNTAEMFDSELPFRKTRDQYKATFPLTEDNFIIFVDHPTPEMAAAVADSIVEQLRAEPEYFEDIYLPGADEFFKKNQLLFLDTTALQSLSRKLLGAQPLLFNLSQDHSIRGLMSIMVRVLESEQGASRADAWDPMFAAMDTTINAHLRGALHIVSWQDVFRGEPTPDEQRRKFIQVKPKLDYDRLLPAKPAIERAQQVVAPYRHGETVVRITGKKAMTFEEMRSVTDGATQAGILALIMVSIIIWVGLRSLRLIAATLITLIIGLLLTAGFSAYAVGQLNMISVAFAVLYIGLGVDYAIHVCLRFRELLGQEFAIRKALIGSLHDVGPALILSTISTALGFYAFIPTSFAGVSELGLIAGTGMFVSLLVTTTLLPALLKVFSFSEVKANKRLGMPSLGKRTLKKDRIIRVIALGVGLITIAFMPYVKFDYDPINLRDPESESVSTIKSLIASGSFTPWTINIITDNQEEALELSAQLKNVDNVDRVLSVNSFIPKDESSKIPLLRSLLFGFSRVPPLPTDFHVVPVEEQIESLQRFHDVLSQFPDPSPQMSGLTVRLGSFLQSLGGKTEEEKASSITNLQQSLLQTLSLSLKQFRQGLTAQQVALNTLPDPLKLRWVSASNQFRVQVFPDKSIQDNQGLRVFAREVRAVAPQATGDLITTIKSGDTVIAAFRDAFAFAFAAITLLLLLYLRSVKFTFLILFPLLLAGALTAAATVIFGIELNFANIIALPLLLGLGVDNGVHIVHRARSEDQPLLSLTNSSTARAIFFSSLTTLFSFGNLAFSPHKGTASMGLLLTIGVLFVLMTTLLILPAFIVDRRKREPI
ncbi:MAG: MMPL family transporter [Bacteroidota bacterium]